jgi:hypothetical protein
MSYLAKLFDAFTQRTPQQIAAAKLAKDVADRKVRVGIPYAARRAAAKGGKL